MPDPTTFFYRLASAISTAEGFFVPNSVPSRNNNPGDIRKDAVTNHPVIGGFVRFPTAAAGIALLYHQLALDIARGYSLRKLVYAWAPPTDGNNSENYLNETARRVGIEPSQFDTPIQEFLGVHLIP